MTTPVRGATTGRASAIQRQRDDLLDEVTSLRAEVQQDHWHMEGPAHRLRESAMRDGRLADYQDATVIVARVERMGRRK